MSLTTRGKCVSDLSATMTNSNFQQGGSYEPDMASLIDQPNEIIADELGVTLAQADWVMEMIDREVKATRGIEMGRVLGWLLSGGNMQVKVYGLAFAFGLDQLNEIPSQTEIAKRLKCTRALVSHYTIAARDAFGIKVIKYRKSDEARHSYSKAQLRKKPWMK